MALETTARAEGGESARWSRLTTTTTYGARALSAHVPIVSSRKQPRSFCSCFARTRDSFGTENLCIDARFRVGDTPWDVKAADRADVRTLAVLTGGFSVQELREAGALDVFESVRELCEGLDGTPLA